MDSQYGEELLSNLKADDLLILMNDKNLLASYIKQSNEDIAKMEVFMHGLHLLKKELVYSDVENTSIISQFQALPDEKKKQVSVQLCDDVDFQHNLFLIMIEIIMNNVPEAINTMNTLVSDLEDYMRRKRIQGIYSKVKN